MRFNFIFLSLFLVFSNIHSQSYELIPIRSTIQWTGYGEVGNFSQSGSLKCKEGSIQLEGGILTQGNLVFDMLSLSHSDKKLEAHLKAEDFFHVKKYPMATLEINSTTQNEVNGVLTIHGISNDVSMEVELQIQKEEVIITGSLSIDRTKYDIKYNSSSYFQDLGSYAIKNEFDIYASFVFAIEQ